MTRGALGTVNDTGIIGRVATTPKVGNHLGAMAVRPEVQRLLTLGRMPSDEDDVSEGTVKAFQDALDDLPVLTDDEAAALLDLFPEGEYSGLFELEWSLLHAIETAPYGPDFLTRLDDRSWWVGVLRQRAQRAGLL